MRKVKIILRADLGYGRPRFAAAYALSALALVFGSTNLVRAAESDAGEPLWSSPIKAVGAGVTSVSKQTGERLAEVTAVPPGPAKAKAGGPTLAVPLKDDQQTLTDITIKIAGQDEAYLPKEQLARALTSAVSSGVISKIRSAPEAFDGYTTTASLRGVGVEIKFDPGLLEVRFVPDADQRPEGNISIAGSRIPLPAESAVSKPALFSGYVNLIASGDYAWTDSTGSDGFDGARIDIAGAVRFADVVLENEMSVETQDESRDIFGRPIYRFSHDGVLRRRTRLTYDLPDEMIRLQAGDTDPASTGFQTATGVLGVSIEKTPRKLAPNENIRPTGRSSFRIERPADVDIVVNGSIMRRVKLRPGNSNISDLPLSAGANSVELVISDDTGETRTLAFSTFYDEKLLASGKNEWSFTLGKPSYMGVEGINYLHNEWFGSGFYRQGVTDDLTGEVSLQSDRTTVMGGLGAFLQTSVGFFSGLGSVSHHDVRGTGYAAAFNWDLINFSGLTGSLESLRFAAEYRDRDFFSAGLTAYETEISRFNPQAYPVLNPYRLSLSSSYTLPLTETISATLSGRYQSAQSLDFTSALAPFQVYQDRYGADVTLSAPLSSEASLSVTTGYSNEAYRWSGDGRTSVDGEFRTMVRLFVRPMENITVLASYDTLNKSTAISASQGTSKGIDRWETSASVQREGLDNRTGANGAINYTGNRVEASVAHSTAYDGLNGFGQITQPTNQRTTIRVGTAVVFADGRYGVSSPIRGNGFAIVTPHKSLAGRDITVGSEDAPLAKSDWLGPAVIRDLPAYTPNMYPIDVAELPVGYSLGTGAFNLLAPYRAGYALEVGSANSVTAFGTLLHADGSPMGLATASAQPESGGAAVQFFTNQGGRFGAEGLAPGRWAIDVTSETGTAKYLLEVPDGTDGLFRAGELRPRKGA